MVIELLFRVSGDYESESSSVDDRKVLETKDEAESDRMTDETSRLPKSRLQPNVQAFVL